MLKRYSPLIGLAEKRQRISAAVEKHTKDDTVQPLMLSEELNTVNDINETVFDLTRSNDEISNEAIAAPIPLDTVKSDPLMLEPDQAVKPRRRNNRVKTTLLGFDRSDGRTEELFKEKTEDKAAQICKFPTGWLVVIQGPGRGTAIALHEGVSQIGRDDDQAVQLDFGDSNISRENHAAVAYDNETHIFYLGHGGKTNIVRLNGTPVLGTEAMSDGDLIRIGETTLRLVAFCNEEFSWTDTETKE